MFCTYLLFVINSESAAKTYRVGNSYENSDFQLLLKNMTKGDSGWPRDTLLSPYLPTVLIHFTYADPTGI